MPPDYYKTKMEEKIRIPVDNKISFMYSEFGCIVDYLIKTYGRDKFLEYMKRLTTDSHNEEVFKNVYSEDFDNFIGNFKKHVKDSGTQMKGEPNR